jgi:peptide chain release factor 2
MQERTALGDRLEAMQRLEQELSDNVELIALAEAEKDQATIADAEAALAKLKEEVARRELEALLSGEADANDSYLEVHAGSGGTESQDWAEMLARMYARWAQAHGYKVNWIDESAGEGAGIKNATLEIKGKNAYGWLKTEAGVHRLVRISPYDANARRHTSFAGVNVYPAVDEDIKIEINEKDVRVDTLRSGGAGGQHVNKTESAVRLVHLPTGITVMSQSDRSQHKNRAEAWRMLRSKLYEAELKKREEKAAAEQALKTDIGWGHQIRSYVLQPYQLVKDLRTGVTSTNPTKVLDGDLDAFMQAELARKVRGGGPEKVEDVE